MKVATVTDSDATLTGLPTGKTVRIQITAYNPAGESQPSASGEAVIIYSSRLPCIASVVEVAQALRDRGSQPNQASESPHI